MQHYSTNPTIGIIGGGQLGKMISQDAQRMGTRVVIIDPDPLCPAHSVSDEQIVAQFDDEDAIRKLAKLSDVLTFEIELANSNVLKELEREGKPVHPSPETLRVIQDKYTQKSFLRTHGLPVPDFVSIESLNDLHLQIREFGFPVLLKATTGSYDGRGNFLITSPDQIEIAYMYISGRKPKGMMLERYVPFRMETSVIAARNTRGQMTTYPMGENVHENNILQMTIVPGRGLDERTGKEAREIAYETLKALEGAGVFGIELFVTQNGQLLINEIAPRVHNSGHWTIEGSYTSQFQQHLRAILGLPLGMTDLRSYTVMHNILGESPYEGPYKIYGLEEALSIPGVYVHMYGKRETIPNRKMGHLTAIPIKDGEDLNLLIDRTKSARSMIKLLPTDNYAAN